MSEIDKALKAADKEIERYEAEEAKGIIEALKDASTWVWVNP
jgi:hypothetical protein